MLSPESGMLAVGMPSWMLLAQLGRVRVWMYLFAAAPEACDYGPAQLERERRLGDVWAGDGVAGSCGAHHAIWLCTVVVLGVG
jgi:hypothetical protein